MPYGLYMSAAGANAQSHRLEVLSHNLANINTSGFKPHVSVLQGLPAQAVADGDAIEGMGTVDDVGGGVTVRPSLTMFQQGAIQQTGNPTDFAINDNESFFSVQRGDKQLLTRAGNFTVNSDGILVSQHGDPVLSEGGGNIIVDPTRAYHVTDDGAVVQDQVRQMVGTVRPRELGDLTRVGDNLFESLAPIDPVPAKERAVTSHALEASAVQPTGAMMELIEASRVYEANIRMIQHQDEATGKLVGRLLK